MPRSPYSPDVRKRLLVLFLMQCCLILGRAQAASYPDSFENWVRERVGPVAYPSTPDKGPDWNQLTTLSLQLGSHAIKTWVGAMAYGDLLSNLKTPPYQLLIDHFGVVHLNLSQSYIKDGMQGARFDPQTFQHAIQEWRDVTAYLCERCKRVDQIVLLSVGAELNIYLGTDFSEAPLFPVADYVNACHRAVVETLARFPASHAQIYTVGEIQTDVEFDAYVQRWVPQLETDLISISHYSFYRDICDPVATIRKAMKPIGPFGKNRLMLGEFGPTVEGSWIESGNSNQRIQAAHHDRILRTAFKEGLQFAFFYELADQPKVIDQSGHDGLVGWYQRESFYRLAWFYYRTIYSGGPAQVPDFDLYERPAPTPPRSGEQLGNLVLTDVRVSDAHGRSGEKVPLLVTVENSGTSPTLPTSLNFFVDDVTVAHVNLPALTVGRKIEIASNRSDSNYTWKVLPGPHRLAAAISLRQTQREQSLDDNSTSAWINLAP